jgi:hypothetical protein
MGKFYDYLVSNGATAEEAKILDTPLANKLYEKQISDYETLKATAEKTDSDFKNYEEAVQKWYEENNGKLKGAQDDAIAARAEQARDREILKQIQAKGLYDVAKNMNFDPNDPVKKEPPAPSNDEKYISRDEFRQLMGESGVTLARIADFKDEYSRLFPGQIINTSELLAESKARGAANMFDYAEKKFNLPAKRAEAAEKARNDEIAKYRAEGRKEAEAEYAKQGNPYLRTQMPSSRPIFQARSGDAIREGKQPWDQNDGKLSEDRVNRAINKFNERQFGTN